MRTLILRKIVIFGVLSAMISLILACFSFGVVEVYKIKTESLDRLDAQMDLLTYNLESTLLFDDRDAAEKTLRSLHRDLSINRIELFKANGREWVAFVRSQRKSDLQLTKKIFYNHKLLGWLEVDAVYWGANSKITDYFLICFLIFFISIPASYLISAPIRRQVSQAVLQLDEQSNRLRMLTGQVINTEQMERKRIAAIIHDHLQQLLVAAKLQLGLALREMGKNQHEKSALSLTRVDGFIDEAIRAAKTLTVELRPPVLYEAGLSGAFQWLSNKFRNDHNLDISLDLQETPKSLPDTLKIMIFESVKELLFNVVKYAGVYSAELVLKYEPECIVVFVKDKGKGFDAEHIEKLASDKGFGLFSIRERLKLVNGEMKIKSEPNKGTEIEMRVPISMPTEKSPVPVVLPDKAPASEQPAKRLSVLLVDDHKMVREGIANILKENPALQVVAQAENGLEAVEKAEIFKPDVVIMDINMPKLNGIEATRAIKNKFPAMDIIGLSVQEQADISESMKKAGAITLLNKAGDPQELIRTILACKLKRMVV